MITSNEDQTCPAIIPTIETNRLRLREWKISDFSSFLALKTDPQLLQYYLGGSKTEQQAWDDFCAISGQWLLRGVGIFLVADRGTDKARGFCGLWFPLDIEVPELCWSLFPGNMGKGYATEAALAVRQWAFAYTQYRELVSYIHPDNHTSCAVADRLGAKLKCRIKLYGEDRLVYRHQR